MVLKSYAKLNLSLSVNKKLKNGLHNIQSIYCLIDIYDKIFIKKSKNKNSDQIVFTGPFSKDVNESNNSVKKVLATNKELIGVKVDPDLKTADIDISNNSWPKEKSSSDFEKFKAKIKG